MTRAHRHHQSFALGFLGAGIAMAGAFLLVMLPATWTPEVAQWPAWQVRALKAVNIGLILILFAGITDGWPVTDEDTTVSRSRPY